MNITLSMLMMLLPAILKALATAVPEDSKAGKLIAIAVQLLNTFSAQMSRHAETHNVFGASTPTANVPGFQMPQDLSPEGLLNWAEKHPQLASSDSAYPA
jgi:hypothetical protein